MLSPADQKKFATAFGVFAIVCALAAWGTPETLDPSKSGAWYSVIPPLSAVILAFLTRKLIESLLVAIVLAGLLSTVPFAPIQPASWGNGLIGSVGFIMNSLTDSTNLQILAFVALVLAMITVTIVGGGLHGLVQWMAKYAKGRRSAQVITALMGLVIFIDDYANTMIVGSGARSLTDKEKISREKLAFLVDATAAPIAGVAFVSTWIGYQVGLFDKAAKSLGLDKDGYAMFFDSWFFRFYCLLMIVFVLVNVWTQRDFGPMRAAEDRARKGKLEADDAVPMTSQSYSHSKPDPKAHINLWAGVIPIVGLFVYLLAGMWTDGGGGKFISAAGFAAIFSASNWRYVLSNADNGILIMAQSALFGLVLAWTTALLISKLDVKRIARATLLGLKASILPMTILILAWSLKAACDAVHTGPFLVATVGGVLSPVWFPALLFIVAGLTAFSTGTSWGTMAILIPTAIPIAYQLDGNTYGLTTLICLASVLDGAIFGDHCSPISDTTIMSSISSSCDHIHHVRTQLPYALTVGGISLVFGYIPAAMGVHPVIGLLAGTAAIVGLFMWLGQAEPKKKRA